MNPLAQHPSDAPRPPDDFWDALAPHHAAIEDSYFGLSSLRLIAPEIQDPVLLIGAGQGLIVAELRKKGFRCDGLDFSAQMVHHAKTRRGLTLVHADARAMPFSDGAYSTALYATGVVDFMSDEEEIRAIMNEGRRIVTKSGIIFIAFYRVSPAFEQFLTKTGLLHNGVLAQRESLGTYLLNPLQTMAWVARKAGVSRLEAARLLVRTWAFSTLPEKALVFKMQRIFGRMDQPASLLKAAPEQLPYRNESEIRNLFKRLAIPINEVREFTPCFMVRL
jgi:hypothetical protein